jgi:PPOX class probable F420-dependent enzyme
MELSEAIDFARVNTRSVLTTIRANGKPQMSNVLHHVFDDGLIRVSITADRAKYKNLVREPWAALHITQSDFWAYAVIEGDVELTPVATRTDDATVEAMVADRRVIVRISPNRAYGMV